MFIEAKYANIELNNSVCQLVVVSLLESSLKKKEKPKLHGMCRKYFNFTELVEQQVP